MNPTRSLTARHREVLYLIAAGKSNKEAAAVLGIATKTVDKHRTEIMQRLGVHNSAELVRCAMDSGIL